MSQEPRPSTPPSNSPDGPRHRQRRRPRQRGPRQNGDAPPRQEERRDNRQRPRHSQKQKPRDDRRPRREEKPRRAPAAPATKTTLAQKLVRLLTLGLVKPKANTGGRQADRGMRPPRNPKSHPAVAPVDLETITGPRLFVGNLHYRATESDLRDLFGGIGKVAGTDIVYSSRTYQSKGCGFVEMMSVIDARRAVEELHGQLFMGRPLMLGLALSSGEDEREKDDDAAAPPVS